MSKNRSSVWLALIAVALFNIILVVLNHKLPSHPMYIGETIALVFAMQLYGYLTLVANDQSERAGMYVFCGLVYFPLWALTYPLRAWVKYNNSRDYYAKHGITRWQFLWGRRMKRNDD